MLLIDFKIIIYKIVEPKLKRLTIFHYLDIFETKDWYLHFATHSLNLTVTKFYNILIVFLRPFF